MCACVCQCVCVRKREKSDTTIEEDNGGQTGKIKKKNISFVTILMIFFGVQLTDHLEPKISDFGFSRLMEEDKDVQKTVSVVGPIKWCVCVCLSHNYNDRIAKTECHRLLYLSALIIVLF